MGEPVVPSSGGWSQAPPSLLYFRPPQPGDLPTIASLEAASYPPDEAASRDKLEYRMTHAAQQFLVAVRGDAVVGFACGTCSSAERLTHASMSSHEPGGPLLCVHSVVVAQPLRRQGVASRLLAAYLAYVRGTTPQLREVRLICKPELVPLYTRAGFRLVGASDVEHGADPWLECAWTVENRGTAPAGTA